MNPYEDNLEDDVEKGPFAAEPEKAEPRGMGGARGNDPNANAMEQHKVDPHRHPNDAPPLQPKPDLLRDGT